MKMTSNAFLDTSKTISLYRINNEVISAIKSFETKAQELIPQFLDAVEEWMTSQEGFKVIYGTKKTLQEFHNKKEKYWREFFAANIDQKYIISRLDMGRYYSHINLPLEAYCALISYKLSWWQEAVDKTNLSDQDKKLVAEAIKRLIMFDNGATCVAYAEANTKLIEDQSNTLLQLSTPTIQLWEGILLLPIVGVLDSIRSQNMMEELLKRIASTASPVSIIDIVGVANVDSSVANHLIKIVRATRLLGNTCILSGISPEVAQTLVEVGIDLEGIETTSNLRNALKRGLDFMNMTIKEKSKEKLKEKEETYEP